MQTVLLAGGRGTRLRPLTDQVPKPMVMVRGLPFLAYVIRNLRESGVDDFVICTGYLGEKVREYFGGGTQFSRNIRYSHENEPLGTGGAILNARDLLDESFLVVNADTFVECDYASVYADVSTEPILMVVSTHSGLPRNALLNNGKITVYRKNADSVFNASDAGVYRLSKEVVSLQGNKRFSLEHEIFPSYASMNKIRGYAVHTRFYDIGTHDRLMEFSDYVTRSILPRWSGS